MWRGAEPRSDSSNRLCPQAPCQPAEGGSVSEGRGYRCGGGAAQGQFQPGASLPPRPCRSSQARLGPPLRARQAAASRSRCPRAGCGSAARQHRRAGSGVLGSGPALPASRLPRPAAGELAGPASALRYPAGCRRSPPPAECMRLTLLCCTWREERMGEEGAPG